MKRSHNFLFGLLLTAILTLTLSAYGGDLKTNKDKIEKSQITAVTLEVANFEVPNLQSFEIIATNSVYYYIVEPVAIGDFDPGYADTGDPSASYTNNVKSSLSLFETEALHYMAKFDTGQRWKLFHKNKASLNSAVFGFSQKHRCLLVLAVPKATHNYNILNS